MIYSMQLLKKTIIKVLICLENSRAISFLKLQDIHVAVK